METAGAKASFPILEKKFLQTRLFLNEGGRQASITMPSLSKAGMEANPTIAGFRQISVLLRGEPEPINDWIQQWNPARALLHVAVIAVGTGLYGAAMGYWRDPMQSLF